MFYDALIDVAEVKPLSRLGYMDYAAVEKGIRNAKTGLSGGSFNPRRCSQVSCCIQAAVVDRAS
jgi:hypothetical protein